jgi:hypothetical protein
LWMPPLRQFSIAEPACARWHWVISDIISVISNIMSVISGMNCFMCFPAARKFQPRILWETIMATDGS